MSGMVAFVIFDCGEPRDGGGTYHYGDGDWGRNVAKAKIYATAGEAGNEIEDLDPEAWLRERLQVRRIGSVVTEQARNIASKIRRGAR